MKQVMTWLVTIIYLLKNGCDEMLEPYNSVDWLAPRFCLGYINYNTWKGALMATIDQRLLAASRMIIPGGAVADIGTDHGQLPCFLLEKGLAPQVVATEWGDGPYQRAREHIETSPWSDRIAVRQGNGLEALAWGEVHTVVIMGMGGDLMAEILRRDWHLTSSFARLVLQPMTRPAVPRLLLAAKGWPLIDERVVRSRGRFFVLFSYQPGDRPYRLSALELEVGPQLLQARDSIELEYLTYCRRRLKARCQNLSLSKQPQNQSKRLKYELMGRELEEIIDGKSG
ncbi:MAG TPA: hypothetical protein DER60_02660 [Syntrophomonas sp.]|jgi:tRNA (adenine22-N1)-methyltransferase|nr:hypothetical protein [Syntrophomonas sp.]